MRINPLTQKDFYKADHRRQYPDLTELVYSNFTPRSDKHANMLPDYWKECITFFGLQGFCQWYLIDIWNEGFFNQSKEIVVRQYKRRLDNALGLDAVPIDHIIALHDLGYLPLKIKALPEGSQVNLRVPPFTVENTHPNFGWLTNDQESVISTEIWKPCTNATIALQYKRLLTHYAKITGAPLDFVPVQAHDFSFRGMSGLHDAASSGAAHLLSFVGTDTIPAIDYLENYYQANSDTELVGCSVPATEHSVMCMGGQEDEIGTFRRLITELYPTGIVSIVSDTWDFWKVITEYASTLKPEIMARQPNSLGLNKVVFRPDSGDPYDIIVGTGGQRLGSGMYRVFDGDPADARTRSREVTEAEAKGAVECLWDEFGGTHTDEGFKMLDEHVGLIYGDSITLELAQRILQGLANKGFASNNIVFGIGSFTYQYNTRDTLGFAMKATYGEVDGVGREIFKDPKTDDGMKKSAKGLLVVTGINGHYELHDQMTREGQEALCVMETVFEDGKMKRVQSLQQIRDLVDAAV